MIGVSFSASRVTADQGLLLISFKNRANGTHRLAFGLQGQSLAPRCCPLWRRRHRLVLAQVLGRGGAAPATLLAAPSGEHPLPVQRGCPPTLPPPQAPCLLSFPAAYFNAVFPPEPGGIGVSRGRSSWACSLRSSPPPTAQTSYPPQLFWFNSWLRFLSTFPCGQGAGRWPVPFAFPQTTFVPLHQCFSQSLPRFPEEKVIPFIVVKKLSSKLSSTRVFRLVRPLNCLEFLFLPVLHKENPRFIYTDFIYI